MYVIALLGSLVLLVGAFPSYTSRPDLFPGIDTPMSRGGCASIVAGVAAVAISWHALGSRMPHDLEALAVPAAFTVLQLGMSLRLMASVAERTRQRVAPGAGLLLSVAGAAVLGWVAYSAAHAA